MSVGDTETANSNSNSGGHRHKPNKHKRKHKHKNKKKEYNKHHRQYDEDEEELELEFGANYEFNPSPETNKNDENFTTKNAHEIYSSKDALSYPVAEEKLHPQNELPLFDNSKAFTAKTNKVLRTGKEENLRFCGNLDSQVMADDSISISSGSNPSLAVNTAASVTVTTNNNSNNTSSNATSSNNGHAGSNNNNNSSSNNNGGSSNGGKRDACVGTSVATITEPDCLGPCEPGTSVTLEGIVWHETKGGVLVVNVTWRGKSYVGTLLDCTQHDWAPPRFCDSPNTDESDSRTPKGRGKRGRNGGALQSSGGGGNGSGGGGGGGVGGISVGSTGGCGAAAAATSTNSTALEISNVTETRSGKVRGHITLKGRRGASNSSMTAPLNNFATPNSPQNVNNKRKGRDNDNLPPVNDSKNNKRSRVCGGSGRQTNGTDASPEPANCEDSSVTGTSSPVASPQLIECPEPNCSKKYKHLNGLKYHQTHAHNNTISETDLSNANSECGSLSTNSDARTDEDRKSDTTCNTSENDIHLDSSNLNNNNNNNNSSELVKSTVLRFSGTTSQNSNTSVTPNITTSGTSSISTNGTMLQQPMPLQIQSSSAQQQLHPHMQQQQSLPHPQQSLSQQQSALSQQAQHHGLPIQQHGTQSQQQLPPHSMQQLPPQQQLYHTSHPQQHQSQNYSPVPGAPPSLYPPPGSGYPPPVSTTSQPSHSPLSTLSPQQLQALQCPLPNAAESPPLMTRLPPPTLPMYVYPPNSSPHRSPGPQNTQGANNSIRPVGGSRPGVVNQQTRLPTPQLSGTPPTPNLSTSSLTPSSPRMQGALPTTPQSTPLTSLPGSSNKNGPKNGRENTGEENPRSPAYSDISDAADASPGEGDNSGAVSVDRRDNPTKPDQLLLQAAPSSYVGLGMYAGFEGPFSGQPPYVVRYPPLNVLKPESKDGGKPGEDKKDGPEVAKFPPGQSPFPSGMYPYAGGLAPAPHYTNDPYYAHLAHPVATAQPPIDSSNKDGSSSPNVAGQSEKSAIPNAYRTQPPIEHRILSPLLGAPLSLIPQHDKSAPAESGSSSSKDGKSGGDGTKPDGSGEASKINRDQPPVGAAANPFYPAGPGFSTYALDTYRAIAAAGLPGHFPPSPYLAQQIRYPPLGTCPEDMARSPNTTSTSTPPPPQGQYAPHVLTPHKISELHERLPQGSPNKPPTLQQQGSANKDVCNNSGGSSNKPSTPTPSSSAPPLPIPGLDASKAPSHFPPAHYHQLLASQYPPHHYAALSNPAAAGGPPPVVGGTQSLVGNSCPPSHPSQPPPASAPQQQQPPPPSSVALNNNNSSSSQPSTSGK